MTYDDSVVDFIFKIAEKDRDLGARPISRAVRGEIENRMTDKILSPEFKSKEFNVHVENGELFVD